MSKSDRKIAVRKRKYDKERAKIWNKDMLHNQELIREHAGDDVAEQYGMAHRVGDTEKIAKLLQDIPLDARKKILPNLKWHK